MAFRSSVWSLVFAALCFIFDATGTGLPKPTINHVLNTKAYSQQVYEQPQQQYQHSVYNAYGDTPHHNLIRNPLNDYQTKASKATIALSSRPTPSQSHYNANNINNKNAANQQSIYKAKNDYGKYEESKDIHLNEHIIDNSIIEYYDSCPSGYTGPLPYEYDCSKFLNCWRGKGYVQNCGVGTVFNPDTLECDRPSKVKCRATSHTNQGAQRRSANEQIYRTGRRIESVRGNAASATNHLNADVDLNVNVFCRGSSEGLLPHPTDCTKFINCANGNIHIQQCGPGTAFSQTMKICDHVSKVDCGQRQYTENIAASEGLIPSDPLYNANFIVENYNYRTGSVHANQLHVSDDILCADGLIGQYPYPFDYTKFINCQNGKSAIQNCMPNNVFSISRRRCEIENYVQVTDRVQQMISGVNAQTLATCPPGTQGVHLYPYDAKKYIKCNGNRMEIIHCPSGKLFSVSAATCLPGDTSIHTNADHKVHQKAESNQQQLNAYRSFSDSYNLQNLVYCPVGSYGVYPHPFDCTKYLKCINGHLESESCNAGNAYSLSRKVCDSKELVNSSDRVPTVQMLRASKGGNSRNWNNLHSQTDGLIYLTCPPNLNGYFLHPFDCTKYIQCSNGQTSVESCSTGTVFSISRQTCVSRDKVEAYDRVEYKTTTTNEFSQEQNSHQVMQNENFGINCPPESFAIYVHPTDQQKFIRCINGQVTVEVCPHQQLFNAQHGFCQPYEATAINNNNNNLNSLNDNQPIYNRGYNPPSNYNNIPPTVQHSRTYNTNPIQRNITIQTHSRGSNKGYNGVSNRGYSRSYNSHSQNNLLGSNNFTTNIACSIGMEGSYQHPNDCHLYLNCNNGRATVMKCPANMIFNSARNQCERPVNVADNDCNRRDDLSTDYEYDNFENYDQWNQQTHGQTDSRHNVHTSNDRWSSENRGTLQGSSYDQQGSWSQRDITAVYQRPEIRPIPSDNPQPTIATQSKNIYKDNTWYPLKSFNQTTFTVPLAPIPPPVTVDAHSTITNLYTNQQKSKTRHNSTIPISFPNPIEVRNHTYNVHKSSSSQGDASVKYGLQHKGFEYSNTGQNNNDETNLYGGLQPPWSTVGKSPTKTTFNPRTQIPPPTVSTSPQTLSIPGYPRLSDATIQTFPQQPHYSPSYAGVVHFSNHSSSSNKNSQHYFIKSAYSPQTSATYEDYTVDDLDDSIFANIAASHSKDNTASEESEASLFNNDHVTTNEALMVLLRPYASGKSNITHEIASKMQSHIKKLSAKKDTTNLNTIKTISKGSDVDLLSEVYNSNEIHLQSNSKPLAERQVDHSHENGLFQHSPEFHMRNPHLPNPFISEKDTNFEEELFEMSPTQHYGHEHRHVHHSREFHAKNPHLPNPFKDQLVNENSIVSTAKQPMDGTNVSPEHRIDLRRYSSKYSANCTDGPCRATSDHVCGDSNDCITNKNQQQFDDSSYEVHLVDGENLNAGRIEVKFANRWGYVCDDKFGLLDADVVCRELGFQLGALEVRGNAYYAPTGTPLDFLMDQVECKGNETSLRQCHFLGSDRSDCGLDEVVGVVCKVPKLKCPTNYWLCNTSNECIPTAFVCDVTSDCEDGSDESDSICRAEVLYRLEGGRSKKEGRLEVFYHGEWGTVCDDDFGVKEAQVVCNSLGYYGKANIVKNIYGPGSGPIWLYEVSCLGNETHLHKCNHWAWGENNCNHTEDIGLICTEGPKLLSHLQRTSTDINHLTTTYSDNIRKTISTENETDYDDLGLYQKFWQRSSKAVQVNKRCGHFKTVLVDEYEHPEERVVNGTIAKRGRHPWQATIRTRGRGGISSHWCGAVLISKRLLLTAAHCLAGYPKGSYFVRLGDHYANIAESSEVDCYIENWYIHENFRDKKHMNNDIALVLLKNSVHFNDYVQPVCLPVEDDKKSALTADRMCTISGWGSIKSGVSTPSNILRAARIPILADDVCRQKHVYGKAMTDNMFCAGSMDESVDACDGDSGGPLVCSDEDGETLYGIISWGQHCGYINRPGVYVHVQKYIPWIHDKIRQLIEQNKL